jgi:hypothetical protein
MNKEWKNIEIKGLEDGDLYKYSIKKLGCIEGGKTQGKINAENGHVKKAASISATKQWKENREGELKKCIKAGQSAYAKGVGCHSLSKNDLSNAGKKGYENGLGKLSKQKKKKIASTAGKANRDINSKFTKEDVIFMRKNFIPRHPEFGVVAFAKKYNTEECTVRNAIKGRTFKDIK